MHDIICQFVCNAPSGAVSLETATHLYRIGQEAVRNAVRHARASRIELVLRFSEGEFRLEVRDNGTGLQDDAVHGSGLGIRLMRYRASVLGGQFIIQNLADGGTLVACTVPAGGQDLDDTREGQAQGRSSARHGRASSRDLAKGGPAV